MRLRGRCQAFLKATFEFLFGVAINTVSEALTVSSLWASSATPRTRKQTNSKRLAQWKDPARCWGLFAHLAHLLTVDEEPLVSLTWLSVDPKNLSGA